jgi:hypothetical protein
MALDHLTGSYELAKISLVAFFHFLVFHFYLGALLPTTGGRPKSTQLQIENF